MTEREIRFLGRGGRFVWSGAAALLLVVLAASFVLSGSSVWGAEREAQERAESLASVVEEQLTPEMLARDIEGPDSRDLTIRVQAGILSDDRFEVVRIWRLDGGLIYSTAQGDDVNGVAAGDDPWVQQALGGKTVSVLSNSGTYHEGLMRPDEQMFQTFIPIRLSGDAVYGVVQIDQRYGAIRDQALRLWRPVQIIALLLVIGAGVMLARTFRGNVTYGEGGIERRDSPGRRANDLSVREALGRADHAERRVRETEKRLAELEARLARAPSATTAAFEELDLKLRASEAEREELAGSVKRLQAELAETQAEVMLARKGSTGTRADTKRVNKLIADAESKAVAAELKAATAEKKAQEAVKRATMNAERGLELEAQLREAEELAADAKKRSGGLDQQVAESERWATEAAKGTRPNTSGDREMASELGRPADERDRLVSKLEELERALSEAEARAEVAERELAVKDSEPNTSAEASASAAALEERAIEAERKLAGSEERFADTQDLLADALGKLRDLEEARAELDGKQGDEGLESGSEPGSRPGVGAELETRIAELENARRADVVELHRAQEAFANAELELSNTNRKLREAEARVEELERSSGGSAKQSQRRSQSATESKARSTSESKRRSQSTPESKRRAPSAPESKARSTSESKRRSQSAPESKARSTSESKRRSQSAPESKRRAPSAPVPAAEPVAEEAADGLSLRTQLARAAAARRRLS